MSYFRHLECCASHFERPLSRFYELWHRLPSCWSLCEEPLSGIWCCDLVRWSEAFLRWRGEGIHVLLIFFLHSFVCFLLAWIVYGWVSVLKLRR